MQNKRVIPLGNFVSQRLNPDLDVLHHHYWPSGKKFKPLERKVIRLSLHSYELKLEFGIHLDLKF